MSHAIIFGGFRLDVGGERLWKDGQERPLRSKSFAVLRYLAEHPARLVTRAELLRAVWPGTAVSPGVVRISVAEVRAALGDDPAEPRFVETVGRRGYRFRASSEAVIADPAPFVGRDADLAALQGAFDACRMGHRRTVFVTGEPGIGKSTLLNRFCTALGDAGIARTALGQCSNAGVHAPEHHRPLLDLLGALCRDDDRGDVVTTLERWAPSWLLQLPGVLDPRSRVRLQSRTPAAARDGLVRELVTAFEILGRAAPLVLVVEDLHWSDPSTMNVLGQLAERTDPTSILLLGSYRPVDAIAHHHPIGRLARALVARRRAVSRTLAPLAHDDVRAYLAQRLGTPEIAPSLVDTMHERTDGNPLFLESVVQHALDTGLLVHDGAWQLAADRNAVPDSIRALVEEQIDRLDADEHAALGAASVVGRTFDADTVAAALDRPVAVVDRLLGDLAAREQQVCTVGTVESAGEIVGRYEFLHAMHQSVICQRLPLPERARLQRRTTAHLAARPPGRDAITPMRERGSASIAGAVRVAVAI